MKDNIKTEEKKYMDLVQYNNDIENDEFEESEGEYDKDGALIVKFSINMNDNIRDNLNNIDKTSLNEEEAIKIKGRLLAIEYVKQKGIDFMKYFK